MRCTAKTPRRARETAPAEKGHLAFNEGRVRRQHVGCVVDENTDFELFGGLKRGHPVLPIADMLSCSGECRLKCGGRQLRHRLPRRHTHPPRAMMAAQSRMI